VFPLIKRGQVVTSNMTLDETTLAETRDSRTFDGRSMTLGSFLNNLHFEPRTYNRLLKQVDSLEKKMRERSVKSADFDYLVIRIIWDLDTAEPPKIFICHPPRWLAMFGQALPDGRFEFAKDDGSLKSADFKKAIKPRYASVEDVLSAAACVRGGPTRCSRRRLVRRHPRICRRAGGTT